MTNQSTLDDYFGKRPDTHPLGLVVSGSLSGGLAVKLDPRFSMEHLAVGRYVVIQGRETGRRFFGIITDIELASTNQDLARRPPAVEDDFAAQVYSGGLAFGVIHVTPMLALDENDDQPKPIKTIPAHFSPVYEASAADVERVFGAEDPTHFYVGTPLEMEQVQVNLDLKRLVERSSGVFGKSGTGKSFVTRTLLAGIVQSGLASALVFDMHNDYGWSVRGERGEVKGLRQLYPGGQVSVITLDPDTSRARNSKVDRELTIGYDQLAPEDVEMLGGLMALSDVQTNALYYLRRRLGPKWVAKLMEEEDAQDELSELVESGRIVAGTLDAIQRKFQSFFGKMGFLRPGSGDDVVDDIFLRLNQGRSVVLEFGAYGNTLAAYLLVANFLTRRIHSRYVQLMNRAAGGKADEPRPLVIVIEEAHKFLDPQIAANTIFGIIARELRKYNVTLLIVDQRPSGIDDEVMSQIGTRVTGLLDNEADIRAVFSGVSGAGALREVLARLDTSQQVLILGHAVPMPVVVRTRDYDSTFYASLGSLEGEALQEKARDSSEALFGE